MIGFLALAFPLVLLVFMLAMERVESPLRRESRETHVQEFLESASAADVENFVTEGVAGAIEARRRLVPLRLTRRRNSA